MDDEPLMRLDLPRSGAWGEQIRHTIQGKRGFG